MKSTAADIFRLQDAKECYSVISKQSRVMVHAAGYGLFLVMAFLLSSCSCVKVGFRCVKDRPGPEWIQCNACQGTGHSDNWDSAPSGFIGGFVSASRNICSTCDGRGWLGPIPSNMSAPGTNENYSGVSGMIYGMLMKEVRLLAVKNQWYIEESLSSDEALRIENVVIESQVPNHVYALFENKELYAVVAYFIPKYGDDAFKLYELLKNTVTNKYGTGKETKEYGGSYREGEESIALLNGKLKYECTWRSVDSRKTQGNYIILEIKSVSQVALKYIKGN